MKTGLDLVVFRIGASPCAVEARHALSLGAAGQPQVPAGRLFGFPGDEEGAEGLTLDLGEGSAVTLGVRGPVELRSFGADRIRDLPGFVASQCSLRGLRALVWDRGGPLLVFDPRRAAGALGLEGP